MSALFKKKGSPKDSKAPKQEKPIKESPTESKDIVILDVREEQPVQEVDDPALSEDEAIVRKEVIFKKVVPSQGFRGLSLAAKLDVVQEAALQLFADKKIEVDFEPVKESKIIKVTLNH